MTALRAAGVTGLGAHRPARRDDNSAIAARIDSSDTWIRERSGIVTRGVAGDDEGVVAMSISAASKALASAGVDPATVDLVLLATCSLPGKLPGGSPAVAAGIGATRAGATDLNAACAGFAYGLQLAADSVRAGTSDTVVVIGAEKLLDYTDPEDRGTAFIFGDGAGAAVVQVRPDGQDTIGPVVWQHDGDNAHLLTISSDGPGRPEYIHMDGRGIYRWATGALPQIARDACAKAGIAPEDLKAFVPHQANLRITQHAVKALKLPDSVVIATDITESGNTSAASVPLALARLHEQGAISTGDPVLLIGFGAGLTAAGQVIRCP